MTPNEIDRFSKQIANEPKFLAGIIMRMADENLRLTAEVSRLTIALENVLEAVESGSKNGAEAVALHALKGCRFTAPNKC